MRKIVYLIALLTSIQSFGQEIKSELIKTIDSEFYQSVIDVEIHNNTLYLLSAFCDENQANNNFYITLLDINGTVLKQKQIEFANAYIDMVISSDGSIAFLGFMHGDDIESVDYISFYDKSLKKISNISLETKTEGFISGFSKGNEYIIGTNNNSNYVMYKFDNVGNKIEKKSIDNGIAETLETIVPFENGLILFGWSMKVWQESRMDLIKLNEKFEIKDSTTVPILLEKVPKKHKLLENSESIVIWDSIAPVSTFFDTHLRIKKELCYVRHDMKLLDVCNYKSDYLLYSGKLGDKSALFLTQGEKIAEKLTFEEIGIWGKNRLVKLNDNEFIFVTDAIRTDNFDTKIQIYRINKK